MHGSLCARLVSLVSLLLLFTTTLQAAEPPTEPILRLESGMHTTSIRSIGVDRQERFLLTASTDKTLRLWSLADGGLIKTLRVPIGTGEEGKLYATALSPDGRWIAAGGKTGWDWDGQASLYLFDRASGELRRRLSDLSGRITHLCFSDDGSRLAVTLKGKNGIRIWSTETWRQISADKDYADSSYWCDFATNGRLVTSSIDGYLRLYDRRMKRIAKRKALGGEGAYAAVFSPDGSKVAVGSSGSTNLAVLSGHDLKPVYRPDTEGINNGKLSLVAWSTDGGRLFAGGMFRQKGNNPVVVWEQAGRGQRRLWPVADNTILGLRTLSDGGLLVGTGDPAWLRLDAQGKIQLQQRAVIADLRFKRGDNFRLSSDGQRVAFGLDIGGKTPVQFDLSERHFRNLAAMSDAVGNKGQPLQAPRIQSPGLKVSDWKSTYAPKLNGQALSLKRYEVSRALAIAPDGDSLLLGTGQSLRRFDRSGQQQWGKPVPGVAWGVNLSADGRLAVAAIADGTIRWYRYSDGEELLALFVHKETKEWVLWSPSGYYDASPGGDRLIGWHVNNGKDQAADFYPASSFRERFYRPQVVAKILTTLDEAKAIRLASQQGERTRPEQTIAQSLPPLVQLLSPGEGDSFRKTEIILRYRIKNPSGGVLKPLQVLVDGRPLQTERGLQRVKSGVKQIKVNLPKHDLQLSLIAENSHGASPPVTIKLRWRGKHAGFVIKPKLYALAIGVSDYDDDQLDLRYAAKDARDFAQAVKRQAGQLYREVQVNTLENPSSDELLDGLDWLLREVTSKDVAMLFLAGHGVNDDHGDYYYLTKDTDTARLRRTAVEYHDIKKTLSNLSGKTLAFIDTCHSGNIMGTRRGVADITGVINDLTAAENGVVVFASSSGKQYALEDRAWRNGAFTKALVEGLNGKADYTGDGRITINQLDLYLSERVKELTGNRQTPTTTKPQTIADFPIAVRR